MEKYNVRAATLDDLTVLLTFEQGIIKFERVFDPTLASDPINYYDLKELILHEDAEVVVVEYNLRIIASGYAKIKKALPYLDFPHYAYLGFMYTDEEFRGKGVNGKIISYLKEWSKARGIEEVRLTVYDENSAAIKAYEKAGFKKHITEMRLLTKA